MSPPSNDPLSRPAGPSRDKLEVGLSRHEKPKPLLPSWFEEYIGVITVALAVVLVLGWWAYVQSKGPTTILKVIGAPVKQWREDDPTQLRALFTTIENTGKIPATGVSVELLIGGQVFRLQGPETLAPGGTAQYEGYHESFASAPDPLSATVSCANCE